MNSPAFDDETIGLSDGEYTAPGHDNALTMPIALVPSALCEHTFELQSMRNALEQLRAENDNLRAECSGLSSLADDFRFYCSRIEGERFSFFQEKNKWKFLAVFCWVSFAILLVSVLLGG